MWSRPTLHVKCLERTFVVIWHFIDSICLDLTRHCFSCFCQNKHIVQWCKTLSSCSLMFVLLLCNVCFQCCVFQNYSDISVPLLSFLCHGLISMFLLTFFHCYWVYYPLFFLAITNTSLSIGDTCLSICGKQQTSMEFVLLWCGQAMLVLQVKFWTAAY